MCSHLFLVLSIIIVSVLISVVCGDIPPAMRELVDCSSSTASTTMCGAKCCPKTAPACLGGYCCPSGNTKCYATDALTMKASDVLCFSAANEGF